MQTVKFVTTDDEKVYVWCTTDTLSMFKDFLQYILDSSNTPEDFYIIDVEKDLVYSAYRVATEMYNMRKRSFEERMDNIQTGKWNGINLNEVCRKRVDVMEKQIQEIIRQFETCENETEYGEPQAYIDLPGGRNLEVTHEEYGLRPKDQYYSWRVNCSDKEFDDDKFHKTCGVIDKSNTDDITEEICRDMIAWAYRVCESVR